MKNLITEEIEEKITNENPIEIAFISSKGEIETILKNQIDKGNEIEINNHYDTLEYFLKKKGLATEEQLLELKKSHSIVNYINMILPHNYQIILNHTYYGVIKRNTLDLMLMLTNNITDEQKQALKILEEMMKETPTTIELYIFEPTNMNLIKEDTLTNHTETEQTVYKKIIYQIEGCKENDKLHDKQRI